jgi:hypothetical protein
MSAIETNPLQDKLQHGVGAIRISIRNVRYGLASGLSRFSLDILT